MIVAVVLVVVVSSRCSNSGFCNTRDSSSSTGISMFHGSVIVVLVAVIVVIIGVDTVNKYNFFLTINIGINTIICNMIISLPKCTDHRPECYTLRSLCRTSSALCSILGSN